VEPQRGYPRATRELPGSYPGATLELPCEVTLEATRVTLELPWRYPGYPGATLRGYPRGYPGGTLRGYPGGYPGATLEVPRLPWRLPKSYPRGYPGVTQVTLEATREVTQRGYPGAP
jgi:hypothetical protein